MSTLLIFTFPPSLMHIFFSGKDHRSTLGIKTHDIFLYEHWVCDFILVGVGTVVYRWSRGRRPCCRSDTGSSSLHRTCPRFWAGAYRSSGRNTGRPPHRSASSPPTAPTGPSRRSPESGGKKKERREVRSGGVQRSKTRLKLD